VTRQGIVLGIQGMRYAGIHRFSMLIFKKVTRRWCRCQVYEGILEIQIIQEIGYRFFDIASERDMEAGLDTFFRFERGIFSTGDQNRFVMPGLLGNTEGGGQVPHGE